MDKHLMVTVSADPNIFHGVWYTSRFFDFKHDVRLTLFHIAPNPPTVWPHEMDHQTLSEKRRRAEEIEQRGRFALAEAKKNLVQAGFLPEKINEKFIFGSFSKIKDIAREGEYGLYDAVVLGQKGYMGLEDLLQQSVSKQLLGQVFSFPLWLCRMPERDRRNVLLCVDGSKPSLRMADHAGYMLSGEPGHDLTMLRVLKKGQQDDSEEIFAASLEKIVKEGTEASRVTSKVCQAESVSQAILREAEQGRYSAVALGRTGSGSGLMGRIFFGSVSGELFKEIKGAALWVCH